MSRLDTLAREWFVPIWILILRNLTVTVFALALLIGSLGLLRGETVSGAVTLAVSACWLCLRFALPDPETSSVRLTLSQAVLALLAFLTTAALATKTHFAMFDIWSVAWLVLPLAVAAFGLFHPNTLEAVRTRASASQLSDRFETNRLVWPRYQTFMTHLALAHACALVIVPVIWIADIGLSPGNLLGGKIGDAFTLAHFETILSSSDFWTWTRNSLIIAFGTTIFGLALAIPAAYAFSRFNFSGRKEMMFAFILVQMFPGAIILVPYFLVMKTLGLLNSSVGLIIVYSVTALPLCIWMLKSFFDAVPKELEEAARIDGCTTLQVFFKIVLPLSLPAIAVTSLFSFILAWNEFVLALVFNTSSEHFTLPIGLAAMIPGDNQRWGDFAAASMLVSIPVVVLFIAFQNALARGFSSGAVKG